MAVKRKRFRTNQPDLVLEGKRRTVVLIQAGLVWLVSLDVAPSSGAAEPPRASVWLATV
jgi:hypothetical protein